MTVTYTADVATCLKFGSFIKLLSRWRGSIYKLIWMDLVLFLVLYYIIHVIYQYLISGYGYKETFESIVVYCSSYLSLIPLSFVLGFYVNLVMSRWWEQYITIPWPDSVAVFVSACVHGQDEGGRLMRRTIMRYVCLCLTIVFTMISPGVKKRFPRMKHLVEAGLLLESERQIFEKLDNAFPKYPKHWMPIIWAASIITRARKEGRIRDDFAVKTIIDELNDFRGRCGTLLYYDFISIPLVYTQVVTIAVYSFFLCSLLAHQWTEKKNNTFEELDFYYPIFITLQFFFYMGWLKVAETLINPFGEDDDDFEVNWMIDRNLQISYLIVDEMHHEHPELLRDQYWDEVYPSELPYISKAKKEKHPESSTAKYDSLDLQQSIEARPTSKTNFLIVNGRYGSTVSSSRSQRFTEAIQRFFNYSQAGSRSDADSFQSDIENVQHVTSYIYSDQAEFESKIENEIIGESPILEPIPEECEPFPEKGDEEEDVINAEEEEHEIEIESSNEIDTDSDSDPFERLRTGRQRQRLQRMKNFLVRHFGSNYQILTQFQDTPEFKFQPRAQEQPLCSVSFAQLDDNGLVSNEFKVKITKSPSEMEDDETLLTPKRSTTTTLQKINWNENSIQNKKSQENGETNERNPININSDTRRLEGNMMKEVSGITLKAEETLMQSPFIPDVSNVPEDEIIENQANVLENASFFTCEQTVSVSTLLEGDSVSSTSKFLDTNFLRPSITEAQPTALACMERSSTTSKDLYRTLESKATSPLGSPIGLSVQSSSCNWPAPISDIRSSDEHGEELDESDE